MINVIPNSLPVLKDKVDVYKQLQLVLDSGRLILGRFTQELESGFESLTGRNYAIAVSSGTSALEVCLSYVHVSGAEVLVPANIFVADLAAIVRSGGVPRFFDVDPSTGASRLEYIQREVSKNTKAIILFHPAGYPIKESAEIVRFCEQQQISVIEDGSHSHGAELYVNKKIGSFGLASCFSLYPTKIVTGGTGGVIVTDDVQLSEFAKSVRHHGLSPDGTAALFWGHNLCLPEFSAVVALNQLKNIDNILLERRSLAKNYDELLKCQPWIEPVQVDPTIQNPVYYKYVVKVSPGIDVQALTKTAYVAGIQLGHCYRTVAYKHPCYEHNGIKMPGAEEYCKFHVTLPLFNELSFSAQDKIVEYLVEYGGKERFA